MPEQPDDYEPTEADIDMVIEEATGKPVKPPNLAAGFTTKKDGHGFGLHNAALAAKEMAGSLAVQSDGPGRGATFALELPMKLG